jgi:hypothetical protein
MRPSPSRFASQLTLGIVVSMALVQAGAAIEVGGIGRDFVARMTRTGGAQRTEHDGHPALDHDGSPLIATGSTGDEQSLATLPQAAFAPPAPPTDFVWLAAIAPATPTTRLAAPPARGRAPPAV